MPLDPTREAEVRERIEREFNAIEEASKTAEVGILDVLQVYGGLETALRQADGYIAILNPTLANFSTGNSSNSSS